MGGRGDDGARFGPTDDFGKGHRHYCKRTNGHKAIACNRQYPKASKGGDMPEGGDMTEGGRHPRHRGDVGDGTHRGHCGQHITGGREVTDT